MKNSPLITILLVAVCLVAVLVAALGITYESRLRSWIGLQQEMAKAQGMRNLVNAVANDALEYSKHNAAIDPILQEVNVKPGKAAPPAPKPQAK